MNLLIRLQTTGSMHESMYWREKLHISKTPLYFIFTEIQLKKQTKKKSNPPPLTHPPPQKKKSNQKDVGIEGELFKLSKSRLVSVIGPVEI